MINNFATDDTDLLRLPVGAVILGLLYKGNTNHERWTLYKVTKAATPSHREGRATYVECETLEVKITAPTQPLKRQKLPATDVILLSRLVEFLACNAPAFLNKRVIGTATQAEGCVPGAPLHEHERTNQGPSSTTRTSSSTRPFLAPTGGNAGATPPRGEHLTTHEEEEEDRFDSSSSRILSLPILPRGNRPSASGVDGGRSSASGSSSSDVSSSSSSRSTTGPQQRTIIPSVTVSSTNDDDGAVVSHHQQPTQTALSVASSSAPLAQDAAINTFQPPPVAPERQGTPALLPLAAPRVAPVEILYTVDTNVHPVFRINGKEHRIPDIVNETAPFDALPTKDIVAIEYQKCMLLLGSHWIKRPFSMKRGFNFHMNVKMADRAQLFSIVGHIRIISILIQHVISMDPASEFNYYKQVWRK
jgi:hypothetical protein